MTPPVRSQQAWWRAQIVASNPRVEGTADEAETAALLRQLLGDLLQGRYPEWTIDQVSLAPAISQGDFVLARRDPPQNRREWGVVVNQGGTLMIEFGNGDLVAMDRIVRRR